MSDVLRAVEEIEGLLINANEYWNGSQTDGAMSDALCFIETKVAQALSLLPTLRAALAPEHSVTELTTPGGVTFSKYAPLGESIPLAPVTDEEVAGIAERHEELKRLGHLAHHDWASEAHTDRATLLRRDAQREAELDRLREALVQHNERLRSAIAVADRDGAETNWQALRGQLHYTAAEYSELVNAARAALEPKP